MKVRREAPCQRRHYRVKAPIAILIGCKSYPSVDWSLGGYRIQGIPPGAKPGDELQCDLVIPFQGFDIKLPLRSRVVRIVEADRQMAGEFIDIDERSRQVMQHFIEDLIRGTMSPVEDTILRVDTPVTPVSTKPDPNPGEEVPKRRWPLRLVGRAAFYATAGLATILYAFLTIQANFLRLEVNTAVVAAPIQSIIATADGKIQKTSVEPGERLAAGTPIITIEDPKLEADIDKSVVAIDRMSSRLIARKRQYEAEKEKMADYAALADARVVSLAEQVRNLRERKALARVQQLRYEFLLDRGHSTPMVVDEKRNAFLKVATELEATNSELRQIRLVRSSIARGRYFTGEKFDGRLQELNAALDLTLDEIALAEKERRILLQFKRRLVLEAPKKGRIVKYLKDVSSSVKRGEKIALFECDSARKIHAFLTQEEALQIGLGDEAIAYLPSIDVRADIVVESVDRTSSYIEEMNSRYEWRGPKDRSAIIVLRFRDLTNAEIRRLFKPGLPATIIFERREESMTFADFFGLFRLGTVGRFDGAADAG